MSAIIGWLRERSSGNARIYKDDPTPPSVGDLSFAKSCGARFLPVYDPDAVAELAAASEVFASLISGRIIPGSTTTYTLPVNAMDIQRLREAIAAVRGGAA